MAFAAPQFGALMQVPVDTDTDMLSDAPEEGHDFDIDVDAMSDGENQDVDFVLDGGNAAPAEPVDQVMMEAAVDPKSVDAPMGEADHGPDEIMDAIVQVNDGQVGDGLQAPHEPYGASQDASDSLLAPPQQHPGGEANTILDIPPPAPTAAPLESPATGAKASDEDRTPLVAAEPDLRDVQPTQQNPNHRDPQADEKETENPPPHITPPSNGALPDQDQALATEETVRKNPNEDENGLENRNNGHEGEQTEQHENGNDEENHDEAEQTEQHQSANEGTLKKLSLSEYATLVSYDGSKLSLFPPAVDGLPEAFLVDDVSLAEKALRELFTACRRALGASIADDSQLQIEVPGLQLVAEEDSIECSIVTLLQIIDIHHNLNRNDGIEHIVPLSLTLRARPRITARLRELTAAVDASKGYLDFLPEFDDEDDQAEDDQPASEEDEHDAYQDGDGADSDGGNLENEEDQQEGDEAVNETATERDTNSEDDELSHSRPGDDTTADGEHDAYSEDEYSDDPSADAESQNVARDSIELKPDAAARTNQGLGEESEAASDDESPEEFNTLDPFAGDDGEDQPQLNDDYAGPKFGGGKSAAEGAGVYLGAHEATLNEEEEYAQLDDWLAPEEENFGFANDSNADAVNGSGQLGDDAYGNGLEYGGEWANEDGARASSPSKLNESPLGKRSREDLVEDAEPDSDQEAKRVKST